MRAMRGFLAVLLRESAERWLIAVAALLLGLVPFVTPLLPLDSHLQGPDVRSGTALALALIVSYLLALVLGSTVLARDLAERRLAFYFSRPLPGWAIWAGKLGGAALLSLGAGLLVLLPSLLLGDRIDPRGVWNLDLLSSGNPWVDTAFWAGSVLALLLLANALGVMIRSRSPWLLLDLLAAAMAAVLAWTLGARLLLAGAHGALMRGCLGLLAGLLLALVAASAVQVIHARTDLRRGHRLLSLTLWSLAALSILGLGGYSHWVLSASPEDLVRIEGVRPAPAGDWISLHGAARGRADFMPVFLLDTSSGRYFRLDTAYGPWGDDMVFSGDGRRAVWLAASGRRILPVAVYRLDLDRPGAKPVATPISFTESLPVRLALSKDGRYLASIHDERILVEDVDKGRLLLSAPVPEGESWGRDWLRFVENGILRFYSIRRIGPTPLTPMNPDQEIGLHLIDLDLSSGRVARSIQVPLRDARFGGLSPDGHHALMELQDPQSTSFKFLIHDVLAGERSPTVSMQGVQGSAAFLRDGRLLTSIRSRGRLGLRLLDVKGNELRRFDLPGSRLRFGGQPAPGHLVVGTALARSGHQWTGWRCFLLDLERGTLRPVGDGLLPVGGLSLPPGSLGAELFIREKGGLVRIDPLTGRTRVILP